MKKRRLPPPFDIRHSSFVILALVSFAARANDLTVDRRTLTANDSVTIVVSLENAFATVDNVRLPVTNLQIDGEPAVSSEFSWINGTTVRRKVFRFTAHPVEPGAALVGPLVVNAPDGQRDTLGPVALQVLPDLAARSNDPLTILHALQTTSRELFFMVTDVDKTSCYAGEELIVTWYLYNASSVQRWQIARIPKLEDFWIEEINVRNEPPEQVIVGNVPMQKVPIRRVALFPLRSGKLTIGSMHATAEILRRADDSPFGVFEGSLIDVPATSAAVNVDVRPLPREAAGDLVGDVDLECTPPQQRAGGPVAFTVTLSGKANLRSAPPPRFAATVTGEVAVQPLTMDVNKTRGGATMRRSWRVLIFPSRAGTLRVPRVTSDVFSPATAQRVHLECAETTLNVDASAKQVAPPVERAHVATAARVRDLVPWLAALSLLLVALVVFVPRARRAKRLRAEVREIAHDAAPANVRARIDELLARRGINSAALAAEASERGDAYRALRSLLDALERDRLLAHESERDVELRVRDLLQSLD